MPNSTHLNVYRIHRLFPNGSNSCRISLQRIFQTIVFHAPTHSKHLIMQLIPLWYCHQKCIDGKWYSILNKFQDFSEEPEKDICFMSKSQSSIMISACFGNTGASQCKQFSLLSFISSIHPLIPSFLPSIPQIINTSYKSRSDDFRRMFKDVPKEERLIVGENFDFHLEMYQGRQTHVCI